MSFTVKQVEATPNPNAMKFVLDGRITQERLSFTSPPPAADHPLAARLFEIAGVESLMFLGDFFTVVKNPAVKWSSITGKVKKVVAEGLPLISKGSQRP